MGYDIYDRCERLIKRWWLMLIVGVVAVAAGFIVMINPAEGYRAISLWMGLSVLVSGVLGLIVSLSSHNYFVHRLWIVIASLLDVVIGIMLLTNLLLSETILPIVFGVWLMYRGVVTLMQGLDMKGYYVRDAGWVIFGAVLIIAIAFAVLWLPSTVGVGSVVLYVAVAFIVYGMSQVSLAYRLHDIHRRAKAMQ